MEYGHLANHEVQAEIRREQGGYLGKSASALRQFVQLMWRHSGIMQASLIFRYA